MSSGDDPTFAAIVGFGAGIYFFFKGFREYRKYRILADTPEIPIRSIAMGLVEVHGTAKGEQQLVSPVSRTPCFFYKVDIERWEKDSKGRGSWRNYRTDRAGVRFYLEDASGHVLVDADGAELDLERSARCQAGGGQGLGSSRSLFEDRGSRPALSLGASNEQLLDYVAKVGAGTAIPEIFIAPTAGQDGSAGGASSSPSRTAELARQELELFQRQKAVQRASSGGGLGKVFDAIRGGVSLGLTSTCSGQFRLTEYCIFPEYTYDITGTCVENPAAKDEHDTNMLVKGENEPTFLISCRSEREIEGKLRWRAIKYVFGGGILAVVCLAFLLSKLGWL